MWQNAFNESPSNYPIIYDLIAMQYNFLCSFNFNF